MGSLLILVGAERTYGSVWANLRKLPRDCAVCLLPADRPLVEEHARSPGVGVLQSADNLNIQI